MLIYLLDLIFRENNTALADPLVEVKIELTANIDDSDDKQLKIQLSQLYIPQQKRNYMII